MDVQDDLLSDPLRRPDELFRVARDVVAQQRFVSTRTHGEHLTAVVRFLRSQPEFSSSTRWRDDRADRDLKIAFKIRFDRPRLAAALEAFVLAGESSSSFAPDLGVSERAIDCYEYTFFDVRSRRTAVRWLLDDVLESARLCSPEDAIGFAWRLVGVMAGPVALRELFRLREYRTANELAAALRGSANVIAELTLQAGSMRGTLNPRQLDKLTRILAVLRVQADNDQIVPMSEYLENIDAFLDNVTFSIPGRKSESSSPNPMAGCAAELRAHEANTLAMGGSLPNLDEIRAIRLPSPRKPTASVDIPPKTEEPKNDWPN